MKDKPRPYQKISRSDTAEDLGKDMVKHLASTLGHDPSFAAPYYYFKAAAHAVRDRLVDRWITTQRSYYSREAKRVYYLSMEFLPGRFLRNNLINMQIDNQCQEALEQHGQRLDEVEELEFDAGLGNGGLGRLASCFLDSFATIRLPAYGYGIRYDYGIFYQTIENGRQVEKCDNWLRKGDPWVFERPEHMYEVRFCGRVREYADETGRFCHSWEDTENIMAMACDTLIPGYGNDNVINMRLWAAKSTREFNLELFNTGKYIQAMQDKVLSENISRVLYPSEEVQEGRELRLKQQYFFVSATFQDIMRRFRKRKVEYSRFPEMVAVQLNDTHPTIAIPELMRILLDEERLPWEEAWGICVKTFGYTNHTILPEALETWPVETMEKVLPRHMQIIYEINRRFLNDIRKRFPGDNERVRRMSLIQEEPRRVRMAHLGIVGSHSTNGVSKLHSLILKEQVFRDFHEIYPDRFNNKTNGVTPRRWIVTANPQLSELITRTIGDGWITDLSRLAELEPLAEDESFRDEWRKVKKQNKERLARYILRKLSTQVNPDSLFDVHIKRIHEYKRQVLNLLHVITMYNRIKFDPEKLVVPRTVIFAGKAAPGYYMAKLIIRLINSVGAAVNSDPSMDGKLKVAFLPNYCVSQAEKVIAGADLSQQISTAGMEASGTGNMKFAMNGALIIGTLDGANIEIMEEVGKENFFLFGLTEEEVLKKKKEGYRPQAYYDGDPELRAAMDMIASGFFSPGDPFLFKPLVDSLFRQSESFMVLADYRSYIECQDQVSSGYLDAEEWTKRSILNTARMGYFSSDRAVLEYAKEIWNVEPLA
ncbi:MAG: glycogen phosphorylase [Deltaproteobacteria bacterium HGW-Deltaproteobacteria-21]|nr:MAG: glycogen phosphorylase [Deltaproteobacteria bacterium HGW-Deltaproteobacteria-21]